MVWQLGKRQSAYNVLRFDVGTVFVVHKSFTKIQWAEFPDHILNNYAKIYKYLDHGSINVVGISFSFQRHPRLIIYI